MRFKTMAAKAAEGKPFQRRRNLGTIAINFEATWEMFG